eukprot:547483-Alexandrium_andersonii.AAC.1
MVWDCQRFGQPQRSSGRGRQRYESAGPACDTVRMLERSWGARGISGEVRDGGPTWLPRQLPNAHKEIR